MTTKKWLPMEAFYPMLPKLCNYLAASNCAISAHDLLVLNWIYRNLHVQKYFRRDTLCQTERKVCETRVTSVKSLEGILPHKSHISQVFFGYHHSPESH